MKSWTDAINNSSSGVKMFYGKAASEKYTDFQTGFYPRIIIYEFIWNDNPESGVAYGVKYNTNLNHLSEHLKGIRKSCGVYKNQKLIWKLYGDYLKEQQESL